MDGTIIIQWPTQKQFRDAEKDPSVLQELVNVPLRNADDFRAVLTLIGAKLSGMLSEADSEDLDNYPLGFKDYVARLKSRYDEYGFDIDEYERKTDENRRKVLEELRGN